VDRRHYCANRFKEAHDWLVKTIGLLCKDRMILGTESTQIFVQVVHTTLSTPLAAYLYTRLHLSFSSIRVTKHPAPIADLA